MSINLSIIEKTKDQENEIKDDDYEEEEKIELQLGDIILIKDPTNEILNDHTFFIQYIDGSKIKLIDESDLNKVQLKIDSNGVLNNGTIREIELLHRNKYPGYAKQNHLLPGQWITIYFGGDIPVLITGEITNLEEDMIEVNKYPEKEVFYINFDYKGIPENIPIESIQLRDPIVLQKDQEEKENREKVVDEEDLVKVGEQSVLDDLEESDEKDGNEAPVKQIKEILKQNIIEADQIEFGNYMGPIHEYINIDKENYRFNIDTQTNDLLEDILTNIPPNKRTNDVLNNIHIMITRFLQLRNIGSKFDKNKNIISIISKTADDKPLADYLSQFKNKLYWILFVAKNIKKVYNVPESNETDINETDISVSQSQEMVESILQLFNAYKSNDSVQEANKYIELYNSLNPIMTPFISIPPENADQVIYEHSIMEDSNVIINNLDDLYSSAVKKDIVLSRRFVFQRYNTGLSRLQATNVKGSKMIAHRTHLTPNDLLSLQSILTLPEPTIRFSQINLPGCNILTKSNLQLNFLNYWQLLKKNTPTNKVEINDLNTELDYNENNFVDNIKHYVLELEEKENEISNQDKYEKFLKIIIPKIRILFNLTKKYIHGKLSLINVISYLEPFLIYSNDLTYMQYIEMNKFISAKISEFNKGFVENGRLFALLKNIPSQKRLPPLLLELLNQNQQNKQIVLEKYGFNNQDTENRSNSEILKKITLLDYGNLYNTALAFENIILMFPKELNAIFELDKEKVNGMISKESDENTCKNYVIAKRYSTLEELMGDNGSTVYFDKKYDNSPYYLLDDYVEEKNRLSPEEFVLFLSDKLQKKQKYNAYDAEYTAESLVTGFKAVIDGQYAILYNESSQEERENKKPVYYVRKNNEWIEDKNMKIEDLIDESDSLCLIQPNCLYTNNNKNIDKNDCESLELSKSTLVSNALNEILNQFDKNYQITKEELVKRLTSYLEKYVSVFDKIRDIEKYHFYQYNNQQYELGLLNSEENNAYIHSPYESLRDLIMGQFDYVKKQTDLIKFVQRFTRPAIEGNANINDGELETPFWLYCQKTNAKLLPSFIYKLASVFIQNSDKYNETMNHILKVQGKLSDDGDSWVDKYSGYHIKPIDWDNEEEIFAIQSRDLLEEDEGQNAANLKNAKKILNPQSKMIQNVVQSLSTFMGISLDSENEFIIGTVNNLINDTGVLVKKPTYEKHMEEMAKKGKKIPEYEIVYYSTLLYLTLGSFLVAVQTSIPSIRTKKTFPGCVRSFAGFPIEGEGNYAGLTYLACVVHKIKSSAAPWSTLSKASQEKIAESIKTFTVKYLLPNYEVDQKIKEKVNYLLSYPEDDIPDAHSIQMWSNFLPPLKRFKIKNLQNVSEGFMEVLKREIRNGAPDQTERILVIESKIIEFSLAIQECIQKIIDKKTLLLKNSVHPYLDNACCNEKERIGFTVLQYFIQDNFEIANYNRIVENLSMMIRDIHLLTEAAMFLSSVDTKRYYPPVDSHFSEETIYTAFITYCNLNSYFPIPNDLLPLCKNKPEFMNVNETVQETIYKLKRDGHQYSEESLLRLLQLVSRNNIIPIDISSNTYSPIQRLRKLLEDLNKVNDAIIAPNLRDSMDELLDTYDVSVTEDTVEMRKFKNYLDKTNNAMKIQLLNFIKQKGDINNSKFRKVETFIKNISEWSFDKKMKENSISDDGMYNYIQFSKTSIFMFSKVYPNMILNEQVHSLQPPKYWGLSKRHETILMKEVNDFYSSIKKFYGNKSLLTLLHKIQDVCANVILLSQETPALTPIKNGSIISYSVFDKRISTLLFEYYLLQVLTSYIDLTNDPAMIYHNEDTEIPIELDGNVNILKKQTANLLIAYIQIMEDLKSTIDISHDMVNDKVFKLKEMEKDTFTDKLKGMSDEARNVDTILKINKLGAWNKGLTKGLKEYDPENFDQERDMMTKIAEIEKKVRRNPNVDDQNLDFYVEDYIEDMNVQEEADQEDYDMSYMNDDYMDGDYYGDEEENQQDYD